MNAPAGLSALPLVTSVRIKREPGHDVVTLYNRGASGGDLVVLIGDGLQIAARMLGWSMEQLGTVLDDESVQPSDLRDGLHIHHAAPHIRG